MSDDDDGDMEYDPTAHTVAAPVATLGARPPTGIGVPLSYDDVAASIDAYRPRSIAAPEFHTTPPGPDGTNASNTDHYRGSSAAEVRHRNPHSSSSGSLQQAAPTKSMFPILAKLRMPSRASLTSLAISAASGSSGKPFLAVGDAEGNLLMYHLDGASSSNPNDDAGGGGGGGHQGQNRSIVRHSAHDTSRPLAGPQRPVTSGDGSRGMSSARAPLFPQPSRRMTPFPNAFGGFCAVSWLCSGLSGEWFAACGAGVESFLVIDSNGRQLDRSAAGSRSVLDTVRSPGHKAAISAMQASPFDGKALVSASRDGTLRVWNVASARRGSIYAAKHGTVPADSLTETTPLTSCSFCTPHLVGSGGDDGVVQLWDCRQQYRPGMSASVVRVSAGHSVGSLLCHPNERTLVLRSNDGAVRFVDLRQSEALLAATPPVFTYQGESTSSTSWRTGGPSKGTGATLLIVANDRSQTIGSLLAELSVAPGEEGNLLRASSVSSTKSVVSLAYDAHADEALVGADEDVLLRELVSPAARRATPSLTQMFFQGRASPIAATETPSGTSDATGGRGAARSATVAKRQRDDDDFPFLF